MNPIELIKAERERQTLAHGYNSTHDDEHTDGELSAAAASYALFEAYQVVAERYTPTRTIDKEAPKHWPWTAECWRPADDKIRNLVKAGALIVAEIHRLQRAGAEAPAHPQHNDQEEPRP